MKNYRIVAILHSGEKGRRRRPVRSKADTDLLGRTFTFNWDDVCVGEIFHAKVNRPIDYVYPQTDYLEPFESEEPVVARRCIRNRSEEYYEIETETRIYKLVLSK